MIDYESIDFQQFLGNGNFSDVWSSRLETDIDDVYEELVAVKVLKANKGITVSVEAFMNELLIQR